MPEPPRRRQTMGELYAEVYPDATPEMLAHLYEMFGGRPSDLVYSFKDVMRMLEEDWDGID